MLPLIGITGSVYKSPTNGLEYDIAYKACIEAISDAGGLPVIIPVHVSDDVLRGIYERLDGVLLPGGGDIRPSVYGQETHPATDNIIDARDRVELQVAKWAYEEDTPLFGICRGHQVMNVAFGGTLVQDIPSQIGVDVTHSISTPRSTHAHTVRIDPDSHLAHILGGTEFEVNSIHHQSVEQLAPGARVTAFAPDEVVEGLEVPDKTFILSVQWHPEDLYRDDPAMQRLFKAFVEAAGANR